MRLSIVCAWQMAVAALAVALTMPGTTAQAQSAPVYRNGSIACPDGSQVGVTREPGAPAPDADDMRLMCQMSSASHGHEPMIIAAKSGDGGLLICDSKTEIRLHGWHDGDRWPRARLYALCGRPEPGMGSELPLAAPPVPAITSVIRAPATPPATGRLDAQNLRTQSPVDWRAVPVQPAAKFRLTPDEVTGFVNGCVNAAAARNIAAPDAGRRCACRARVIPTLITRREFDAYNEWLVWSTTWRAHVWTVEKPVGVEDKIRVAIRQCANP